MTGKDFPDCVAIRSGQENQFVLAGTGGETKTTTLSTGGSSSGSLVTSSAYINT